MAHILRPYQQKAHDVTIDWLEKSAEPCLLSLGTGSGKSHIIAAIAKTLHNMSGKNILCIAPSKELVEQNYAKYVATGNKASFFSASIGQVSLRYPVVFGTPGTIKNKLRRFDGKFCAVVIDEAHHITPTIIKIIDHMRNHNNNLRVIGLTATPYRLGSGYVYKVNANNMVVNDMQTKRPYFYKCLYEIKTKELINMGYLTKLKIGVDHTEAYEFADKSVYTEKYMEKALEGQGRKTSKIIADIVKKSIGRSGVLIFSATVQHAKECLDSLPPGISAMINGNTGKTEREKIVKDFLQQKIKYLVNVKVLTTGFDATHVDVVAILRPTESVSLFEQMIGRGLRLHDGKQDCLVLDYANNIGRLFNNGDIFDPIIDIGKSGTLPEIDVDCEFCGKTNKFSIRKEHISLLSEENKDKKKIDKNGYLLDLMGNRIQTEYGPEPAHYGRRCLFIDQTTKKRCKYRWTSKDCPECKADNDISAKYCEKCGYELVDPNKKLIFEYEEELSNICEIKAIKKEDVVTKNGYNALRVLFVTDKGKRMVWFLKDHQYFRNEYLRFLKAYDKKIKKVEFEKNKGFYKVKKYEVSEMA